MKYPIKKVKMNSKSEIIRLTGIKSFLSFMQRVHDISLCCCIGAIECVGRLCYIGELREERRAGACHCSGRVAGACVVEHVLYAGHPSPASFRRIGGEVIKVDFSQQNIAER